MSHDSREQKRRVFRRLHDPEGMLYQIAHARRPNTSQVYDGEKLKATYDRVVDEHVAKGRGIAGLLRSRKPRSRD